MRDHLTPLVEFLDKYGTTPGLLLDVGGEGNHSRERTDVYKHEYEDLNISGGPKYDVREDPYVWPIPNNKYDYVISTSTFEHIVFPWLTFLEMVRVTKVGGYIFLNIPSAGPEHHSGGAGGFDAWRFYPDAMIALSKWGNVRLLESYIDNTDGSGVWKTCTGIFIKETNDSR